MLFIDSDGYIYGVGANGHYRMKSDMVQAKVFAAWPIDAAYMNLSHNQEYIEVGESLNLSVDYYDGYNLKLKKKKAENITFESSDTNILTVDENGILTAVSR